MCLKELLARLPAPWPRSAPCYWFEYRASRPGHRPWSQPQAASWAPPLLGKLLPTHCDSRRCRDAPLLRSTLFGGVCLHAFFTYFFAERPKRCPAPAVETARAHPLNSLGSKLDKRSLAHFAARFSLCIRHLMSQCTHAKRGNRACSRIESGVIRHLPSLRGLMASPSSSCRRCD
jgi:hypothetical protein